MQKGKLIVIDGGDGAGKDTQTKRLVERLIREGHAVGTLDFPRYTHNTYGALIRECLDGKHGDFLNLDPKIASTLYAADRFEAKPQLQEWLEEGRIVILDRYVSSNMLHQGAKIYDPSELDEFLAWLDKTEYDIFGLPRPDLVVYLHVDAEQRMKLLQEATRNKENRFDVAEESLEHQQQTENRAAEIVEKYGHWRTINCMNEAGELRLREDINDDLYNMVKEVI